MRHACSASGESVFARTSSLQNCANCRAPSPTSKQCGVSSITRRASEMGCTTPSTAATEPQRPSSVMIDASSVTMPSRSGIPPSPTLRSGQSSSTTRAPASTASSALPPRARIASAASLAGSPCFQVLKIVAEGVGGVGIDRDPFEAVAHAPRSRNEEPIAAPRSARQASRRGVWE